MMQKGCVFFSTPKGIVYTKMVYGGKMEGHQILSVLLSLLNKHICVNFKVLYGNLWSVKLMFKLVSYCMLSKCCQAWLACLILFLH